MQDLINDMIRVFTFLHRQGIDAKFSFPRGNLSKKAVYTCIETLQKNYTDDLSRERIVDFCVCQSYILTKYDKQKFRMWKATNSFGKKALERFKNSNSRQQYFEDKWLSSMNISRATLLELIAGRKQHPLSKYVYLEFEDNTKKRIPDMEARILVCISSTLLWSPFSPVCRTCPTNEKCKDVLLKANPELYRLRVEEYKKSKKE